MINFPLYLILTDISFDGKNKTSRANLPIGSLLPTKVVSEIKMTSTKSSLKKVNYPSFPLS